MKKQQPFPIVPIEELAHILRHVPAPILAQLLLELAADDNPGLATSIEEIVSEFRRCRERDTAAALRATGRLH